MARPTQKGRPEGLMNGTVFKGVNNCRGWAQGTQAGSGGWDTHVSRD